MEHIYTENRVEEFRRKSASVDYHIRLPETEFEIMMAIWKLDPPVTSAVLMKKIGQAKGWKQPTLISFLNRLEERGYLMSYKDGKERNYIPLADRERYLTEITGLFVERVHNGSFVNLLDSLFAEKAFTEADIDALLTWLKMRYRE